MNKKIINTLPTSASVSITKVLPLASDDNMFPVQGSLLSYCGLYTVYQRKDNSDKLVPYKPTETISGFSHANAPVVNGLFMQRSDKNKAIKLTEELFTMFASDLNMNGDLARSIFINWINESLRQERFGNLNVIAPTARELIGKALDDHEMLRALTELAAFDYPTARHSIDTALFMFNACVQQHYNKKQTLAWVKAGLLHDIGKMMILKAILNKPGYLSDQEKNLITIHWHGEILIGDNNQKFVTGETKTIRKFD
ncbi:MAG: hypothetical protein ABIH39_08390, partial [Candidatus Margulisiibacteriota bacterium]